MSTSYFVYCESCNVAVTDPNACDHGDFVIREVVAHAAEYMDLIEIAARLPEVRVEFQGCGCGGFQLDDMPKHRGHKLHAVDEYGFVALEPCESCKRSYCAANQECKEPCCDKCTHAPSLNKVAMGPVLEAYYAAHY